MTLRIDLAADFICPWCHVGDARLRDALQLLAEKRPDEQIELNRLPFFLDESTPPEGFPYQEYLERKFGGAEAVKQMHAQVLEAAAASGVDIDFEAIALRPSTLNAHRLIMRAQGAGLDAVAVSRLAHHIYLAHFVQGENIGDPAVLARAAKAAGFDDPGLEEWLASDALADEVRGIYAQVKSLGIQGVPFFVFNQRLAVSGAHPPESLLDAMEQALDGEG